MDQNLVVIIYEGGILDGLSYQGGNPHLITTYRNITLTSLRSSICDRFSISYEFTIRWFYSDVFIIVDCEETWNFIVESNLDSSCIKIYIVPSVPNIDTSMFSSSQHLCDTQNFNAGPSCTNHTELNSDTENNDIDDENSDDLVENLDYYLDDNDGNVAGCISELFIGRPFDSSQEFRNFISDLAVRYNFRCSSKHNNSQRIVYTCDSPNCCWRVYAKAIGEGSSFEIRTFEGRHSCLGGHIGGPHPLATTAWVKNKIIGKIRDNNSYSPTHIVHDILREYRVHITYSKAWRARELALSDINGSYIDAYGSLEKYCFTIMETNSGSKCFLKTIENNVFQRIFICFKACMDGFLSGCLPVISIDATFLTSRFQGNLFVACAHDPNYQLYPIAYCVAENENTESWTWFLNCLKISFESCFDRWNNISFISDKQKGLIRAIRTIFPESPHFFCIQHFKQNMKNQCPRTPKYLQWLDKLARSYNEVDANAWFETIKSTDINVFNWIVGSNDENRDFSHWITAYSPCPRLDINTSNIAECFNNWIKSLRDKPISTLLDGIRAKIITLHDKHRTNAEKMETDFCPRLLKTMARIMRESHHFQLLRFNNVKFEIWDHESCRCYVVELDKKCCTCGRWQHTLLPCEHACFTCRSSNLPIESYYPNEFSVATLRAVYMPCMQPIPVPYTPQSEPVRGQIGVPILGRRAGRPKKNRIMTREPSTRDLHCSNCGGLGHNKRNCRNQPKQ